MLRGSMMRYFRLSLVFLLSGAIAFDPMGLQGHLFPRLAFAQNIAQQTDLDQKNVADQKLAEGNEKLNRSQFQGALISWQEALRIYREIGDRNGEGSSLGRIGNIYFSLGEDKKAIQYYKQSLVIYRELRNRYGQAPSLGGLGNTYVNLGKYEKAIELYEQYLSISKELSDDMGVARAYGNLGFVSARLNEYEKALAYFKRSLATSRKIGDRVGEATALGNLGEIYFLFGQSPTALGFYQQNLKIAREIGARSEEAFTFAKIGIVLNNLKQPQLAIAFFKQSINITESIRGENTNLAPETQQSYLRIIESKYRALATLLLQEERIVEALQVLDFLKVQELQDFFKEIDSNERTSRGLQLFPEEKQILDSIAQVSDLHTHFQSPIIQSLSQKLQQRASDRNLTLASYQNLNTRIQSLGQDSALLYPLVLGDRLELILFTPNSAPIHKTVDVSEANLQASIRDYRESLQNPNDSRVLSQAKELNDWLLQPLEKDFQEAKVKTIIYAPDGALRYVPISALYDGKQWTIEKYQINYVTAFGLTETDLPSSEASSIIAGAYTDLGTTTVNINQTPFRFGPIPAARPEAEGVSKRFRKTKLLLERDFNKATLTSEQLNQHNIVHLATHGKLVSGNPSDSFILLNNGEYVTLREIKNWNLPNVDLVVLSACETALGEELANGIEIIGFGYQLQVAQARAAIASLWQVSDSGTNSLMNLFYEQLEKGERSPTAALGEAQQKMIQSSQRPTSLDDRGGLGPQASDHTAVNFSHPYFWAPFILIGNGF